MQQDAVVLATINGRGAKLVAGSPDWGNYTLVSDIRFEGSVADMGVIMRSNGETEGTDAYDGYFVGVRSLEGTLVIGRADYGAWVEAAGADSGWHSSISVVPVASDCIWVPHRRLGTKPQHTANLLGCL